MKYIIAFALLIVCINAIALKQVIFVPKEPDPLTSLVSGNFDPVKFTQNKYTYSIKRSENINLEEMRSVLIRYHADHEWINNVFGEIKLMAPNSKHVTGLWTFIIKNNIAGDKNSAELSIVVIKAHANNNDIIDIEVHLADFTQDIPDVYDAVGHWDSGRREHFGIVGRREKKWMVNYNKRNLNQNEIDLVKNRIFNEVRLKYDLNMLT
jgi:hypothetical protein